MELIKCLQLTSRRKKPLFFRLKLSPPTQLPRSFIRAASLKSARNAEYLAKVDRSLKQFDEGKYVKKTTDELERLIHG